MTHHLKYIEVDTIEAILTDNVGPELQWLKKLLESDCRVRNDNGRYVKKDRFLQRIEELQRGKTLYGTGNPTSLGL